MSDLMGLSLVILINVICFIFSFMLEILDNLINFSKIQNIKDVIKTYRTSDILICEKFSFTQKCKCAWDVTTQDMEQVWMTPTPFKNFLKNIAMFVFTDRFKSDRRVLSQIADLITLFGGMCGLFVCVPGILYYLCVGIYQCLGYLFSHKN